MHRTERNAAIAPIGDRRHEDNPDPDQLSPSLPQALLRRYGQFADPREHNTGGPSQGKREAIPPDNSRDAQWGRDTVLFMSRDSETPSPATPFQQWEVGFLAACMTFFVALAVITSWWKSPAADSMLHYRFGEWILGAPLALGDALAWDGTMPVSAIYVMAGRLREGLAPLMGEPSDPWQFPICRIPSRSWAQFPAILMGAGILLIVWWLARRIVGPSAAAGAMLVGLFEPNLTGLTRFAGTDVPSTLGFVGGIAAITYYIERPTRRRAALLAAVLAVAQITKITNLLLYPIAAVSVLAVEWSALRDTLRRGDAIRRIGLMALLVPLLFIATLHVAYSGLDPARKARLAGEREVDTVIASKLAAPMWALRPVIPPAYIQAYAQAKLHNHRGHDAYLLGEYRTKGWWYYFPLAILFKSSTWMLILAAWGTWIVFHERRWLAAPLLLGSLAYLLYFCFLVRVNIGVRHVLPVFPMLILLAGVSLGAIDWRGVLRGPISGRAVTVLGALLFLCHAIGTVSLYPHHEQYFSSILARGPNLGWKYLGDSNLDFGQEILTVERWKARQTVPVHIDPAEPVKGLIAIRAVLLIGLDQEMADRMAWLRENYQPIDQPSPAILIYQVD